MLIKCPKCSIGYNVPDSSIGGKPRKMRCSRCKEVFTITRRSEETPAGYEEFTGHHSALPEEFAFLRETSWRKRSQAPEPSSPSEQAPAAGPAPADAVEPDQEPSVELAQPEEMTQDDDASQQKDIVEKVLREARARRMSGPPAPRAAAPVPTLAAAPPVPPPPVAPPPPPEAVIQAAAPRQVSVVDIYSVSAWETEDPLDLSSYAVHPASGTGGQLVGKILTVIFAIAALAFVFVLYRNAWNLRLADLPAQIAFAFSDKQLEQLPDEVQGLEVTISEKRLVSRAAGSLFVVTGTVFNNTAIRLNGVVLRSRLLDGTGGVRAEVRVPCNKLFKDDELVRFKPGQVNAIYARRSPQDDCLVNAESTMKFQIVFEDVPRDYDPSFTAEVQPIFARIDN